MFIVKILFIYIIFEKCCNKCTKKQKGERKNWLSCLKKVKKRQPHPCKHRLSVRPKEGPGESGPGCWWNGITSCICSSCHPFSTSWFFPIGPCMESRSHLSIFCHTREWWRVHGWDSNILRNLSNPLCSESCWAIRCRSACMRWSPPFVF